MLDDLTPQELAMLGHSLRMVPGNAVLTGKSVKNVGEEGALKFFSEIEAFKSLWSKVAEAIKNREDMEPFRKAA